MVAAAFGVPAAIFQNVHLAILTVLPAAIGFTLLIVRDRPFSAALSAEGIEIEEPLLTLPYQAIQAVLMPGKPGRARAPIQLIHSEGVVRIPARINVRSGDLFDFLIDQLPPTNPQALPAALTKYYAEQEELFGPERVFTFRARTSRKVPQRGVGLAVCGATGLAGLIWIAAGAFLANEDTAPWIAFGILLAIFSGLFAQFFLFHASEPRIPNWQASGLVISPAGLALVQGDLRGELRWDELRDIRLGTRPGFFEFQPWGAYACGIRLIIEGASITIMDVYDRPLALIRQRLRAYWLGGGDKS